MRDIVAVTKEKTARIIPNAVGIRTDDGRVFVFGSLISRDNTFQLLQTLVQRQLQQSKVGALSFPAFLQCLCWRTR